MRSFAIIAAMLACATGLFAEIHIMSSTTGGKTKTISTEQREIPEGSDLKILQKSEEGSVSTLLGRDGTVKSTEIQAKDGRILMESDGKTVSVSGTWKGKALSGQNELKGLGFYGNGFEFALRALARDGLASLKFPMIQPTDPKKAMVMELTREGRELIKGREAIKVKIGLTGIMAAFWSAHVYVASDGTMLRYEGNQGPGTADMVSELIEIRQ
jgi:hypothetical protein